MTVDALAKIGERRLLTKKEMAAYWGMSLRALEYDMHDGLIPFIKRRGKVRFDLAVVQEHDRKCCCIGGKRD